MHIEVLHDSNTGEILGCYCADTLPKKAGGALFVLDPMPEDSEQARINIDTLTAMQIEVVTGSQAHIINDKPVVVQVDRSIYIRENYKVDVSKELPLPEGVTLPEGLKVRSLIKI